MAKKRFNDHPFPYHAEIELEISKLTNLGVGLGRVELPPTNADCGIRNADSALRPAALPAETTAPSLSAASPLRNPQSEAGDPQSLNTSPQAPAERGHGWVIMVPFALPGELVRVRIYSNHKNYSEADMVSVLRPSPHRIAPRCPLFGTCGGCQYQNLTYTEQLRWKQQHVTEVLQHMARIDFPVNPVHPSPCEFGYRSKLTPHFECGARNSDFGTQRAFGTEPSESVSERGNSPGSSPTIPHSALGTPRSSFFPIGFLKQSSRFALVDVPQCPIATDAINARLPAARAEIRAKAAAGAYQRGATVLLRHSLEGVTSDFEATITEEIPYETICDDNSTGTPAGAKPDTTSAPASAIPHSAIRDPHSSVRLRFLARDFFQNNPFILPAFTGYVREQAAASGARFLVDAYCGSGLFALTSARRFERVTGIEISASSVRWAQENAAANGIANTTFRAGDASAIFAGLDFPAADTAVVIDPPRRGCDEAFLHQLVAYGPRTIVYVSCDPATQMRDLATLIPAGYTLTAVQPFDLFPQTRHLECVITLQKS